MSSQTLNWIVGIFFALCLLLGGASNGGYFANFVIQFAAIAIALAVSFSTKAREETSPLNGSVWLLSLIGVVVLLQFLPLPYEIWLMLPGRAEIANELELLGIRVAPTFMTLSFFDSLASFAWLIPSAVLFFCLAHWRIGSDRTLALILLGATLLSLAIGLMQFFGGKDSPAYFYDFTNRGFLVGVFANANHMASLFLVCLPFLAALIRLRLDKSPHTKSEWLLLSALLATLFFVGIALVGSLTGYILAVPVTLLSAGIIFSRYRRQITLLLAPILVVALIGIFYFDEVDNIFETQASSSAAGRQELSAATLQAAKDYFPMGSGLGTFQEVFPRYEADGIVDRSYANHAHNDYLELALELGLPGLIAISAFMIWWIKRARAIWMRRSSGPLVEAAVVASGVLLLHSIWDYPLRTASLGSVFAFCVALIAKAKINDAIFFHAKPRQGSDWQGG